MLQKIILEQLNISQDSKKIFNSYKKSQMLKKIKIGSSLSAPKVQTEFENEIGIAASTSTLASTL